jgi:hypothetical protein
MNLNKLQQYSVFACVFVVGKSGISQTIYTDIDPDIEMTYDYQFEGVDMDNDGDFDFVFEKRSHTVYDTWSYTSRFKITFFCGPYVEENAIVGFSATFGAAYGAAYYPYQLNHGDFINGYLSFQNCGIQLLGNGWFDIDGDGDFFYGPNAGQWEHKVDSAYLGVRFYDEEDCLHYGWIRLSVTDTLGALIIHDYGYEERCAVGLYAGDTTMLVPVQNQIPLDAQVFAHGHEITIITDVTTNTMASIFDINGKLIMSLPLNNNTTTVAMNFPGVFLVEIQSEKGIFTKKVAVI